jgi:hypothetical protein
MTEKRDKQIDMERAAHQETPELLYLFPISEELLLEKMRLAKLRAHFMLITIQDLNSV